MSNGKRSAMLREALLLLVRYFGLDRVTRALADISADGERPAGDPSVGAFKVERKSVPNIAIVLEEMGQRDPERYRLLEEFYDDLKKQKILPEAQDIRYFAQLVGLKAIEGKSRKEMVPKLLRFLMDVPSDQLQLHLAKATNISEEQRRQGYSVLTDKLLNHEK